MKTCVTCKQSKSVDEFNKRALSKDGLQTVCRECNRERSRRYYADNPEKHRKAVTARAKKHKQTLRAYLLEVKSLPCDDCKTTYIPFAMDFDHVRGCKVADVSVLYKSGCSLNKLQEEIAKCDLVCATCHRIRTWNRQQLNISGSLV